MREADFNTAVNKKAESRLRKAWKINDNFQGGVPDNFYLGDSEFWAEFKFLKALPKRPTTVIVPDCSELQYQWLDMLHESKGNACVIVGAQKVEGYRGSAGFVLHDPDEWHNGITCEEAVSRLMSQQELADFIVRNAYEP